MSFEVTTNELSGKIMPFDHQVKKSDDPLPRSAGVIWIMSGKKGSGKSNLILNVLKRKGSPYKKFYDNIFLISPTAGKDEKFKKFISELEKEGKYYDTLDESIIDAVLAQVKKFNEEFDEKAEKRKPENLLILDDCIHLMPKSNTTSNINQLFTTSRHNKLSVWVATQKYNKINPLIRANADLISFFRSDNRKEIATLIDDINVDKPLFEKIYEFCTEEPNSFMHISLFGKIKFYRKFDRINI
jgi:Cdc6-like AAA superfamily ATPase